MKLFQLKTQVCTFDCIADMIKEFNIGQGDFIFASKSIYNEFLVKINLKADIKFKSDYGRGEPTDIMINKLLNDVSSKGYKRIIAIGGGAVIDMAKLLVLKDADNAIDIFEKRIPLVKDKELIIVPTTCGSGSEVSNVSITELTEKGTKYGLATDELYADYAVLIPQLLKDLPYHFFITSSIDALIHAVESYVSPRATSYTELFSIEAIKTILNGFIRISENGKEYRKMMLEDFLTASNYAGIAFANAGTGAVHALSYPLSGKYHVTHGEANYDMFIEVFKLYNKKAPSGKIKKLNSIMSVILDCDTHETYDKLTDLLDSLISRRRLSEYGMTNDEIELFTDSVIKTQQRLLSNSYVPLTRDDIMNIYKNLF